MDRQTVYQEELLRWRELFNATDSAIQSAAAGLIEKAAFVHAICWELQQAIEHSGAIKIHPQHPDIQKQVPAVKEYARMSESYANIVNKLNTLRAKNTVDEDDDDLSEFI